MRKLSIFFLLLCAGTAFGQQQPLFTQYMYNGLAYNPAYAGSRGAFSAIALYRRQWLAIEGSPQTYNLSVHAPLGSSDKNAVGLNIMNDEVGVFRNTYLTGNYAYRIIGKESIVSLGLQATVNQISANYSQVTTTTANDPAFVGQDVSYWLPNFGVGAYWYSNTWFLGASIPTLLAQKRLSTDGSFNVNNRVHGYATAGYLYKLDRTWQFKPSTLLRVVPGAPLQLDLNGMLIYRDKIMAGVSLRNFEAIAPMIQFKLLNNVYAGYAFDLATTKLYKYSAGTHEVFIGCDFNLVRPVVISPRYF